MKIAIIGSGISGLAAAYNLYRDHNITLFEKNNYIGGHANTVRVNYHNKNIDVDTGFIVFNFNNYPNLKLLFESLGVKIIKSNMSFGVKNLDHNFEYSAVNLFSLFTQKRNIFNIKFLKMLVDIVKFNKKAMSLIKEGKIDEFLTLNDFLNNIGVGSYFKKYYLLPMAGAIWSCPIKLMKNYPARVFLQFFYNHGLLTIAQQPQWYSVKGGSKEYIKKITKDFRDKITLNCTIVKSQYYNNKVILTDNKGQNYQFDHVIFASHGDQTYKIIADKTKKEEEILSKFKYSKNTAILHKDKTQMPQNKKAWASWIYLASQKKNEVSLTYWMNNLQNIDNKYPLFVTLNPISKIKEEDIFGKYHYEHPIFDHQAINAQEKLNEIQGKRNMWFCGAWTKYGFHEDGLNSAIDIIKKFGIAV